MLTVFITMYLSQKALGRIRELIKLDSDLPWTETLTVTYPEVIAVDVDDDLNRELALYVRSQPFSFPPELLCN